MSFLFCRTELSPFVREKLACGILGWEVPAGWLYITVGVSASVEILAHAGGDLGQGTWIGYELFHHNHHNAPLFFGEAVVDAEGEIYLKRGGLLDHSRLLPATMQSVIIHPQSSTAFWVADALLRNGALDLELYKANPAYESTGLYCAWYAGISFIKKIVEKI
jgi:hypothetical protein